MKTNDELTILKNSWLKDPVWDIETTEGFEEHKDELLAFRKEKENKWEAEAEARRVASFGYKKQVIEDEIDSLDAFIRDLPADAFYYQMRIATEQVMATVLLAEQVERVADILENWSGYDKYIRGD